MKKALTIGLGFISTVSFAMAQAGLGTGQVGTPGASTATGIIGLVDTLQSLLNRAVPLIISLAVIGLFWFLLQFVWKGNSDPKAREGAIKGMGYSILAIFVMVAIWGIIAFIANLLGVGVGGDIKPIIPKLPS
jgi:hypothetical protein